MSASGTILAALLALCIAPMAARATSPVWLTAPTRLGLNALRSVPSVVWGIMFVAAVGFGPLPGALALACHSTGVLGKLYAETLEHVDPAPGAALRSQGVSPIGVLRFGILPQVLPRLADVTFHRFEHNVHAATVMGLVGRRNRPRDHHGVSSFRVSRSVRPDSRPAGDGDDHQRDRRKASRRVARSLAERV